MTDQTETQQAKKTPQELSAELQAALIQELEQCKVEHEALMAKYGARLTWTLVWPEGAAPQVHYGFVKA